MVGISRDDVGVCLFVCLLFCLLTMDLARTHSKKKISKERKKMYVSSKCAALKNWNELVLQNSTIYYIDSYNNRNNKTILYKIFLFLNSSSFNKSLQRQVEGGVLRLVHSLLLRLREEKLRHFRLQQTILPTGGPSVGISQKNKKINAEQQIDSPPSYSCGCENSRLQSLQKLHSDLKWSFFSADSVILSKFSKCFSQIKLLRRSSALPFCHFLPASDASFTCSGSRWRRAVQSLSCGCPVHRSV